MKAYLIYNAHAGQMNERADLERAVHYLEEQGWEVAWRETHGPGDAVTYAREAVAQGCDVAIAAGGDGTVGEVAHGLAGSETALGVLPLGTSNVWAKEVGIPSASYLLPPQVRASLGMGAPWLVPAARVLVEGRRVRVDLGRVNGRHFLMWAGVGLDARVAEEVDHNPQAKRRLGRLAFYLAGIYTAMAYRGVRADVWVDGRRVTRRVILAVVSNIQLYGGVVRISPLAKLDDGLLDACIFQGSGVLSTARHLVSVFAGRHLRDPQVDFHEAQRVEVRPATPLPVHADGDFIGHTPAVVEVVPQSLTVVVPPDAPSRLFREAEAPAAQPREPRGLLQWLADFVPYDPKRRRFRP
ncbi:MAG: diacylglycerol kinase family lipid kinase [Anaerolineae bacterium]|nr:diacylglycerol kinase family lipid kinase [Anaerolineae bacterium]